MELNNTISVDTLEVPSDQHIKNFIVRCGWYIDAIAIETNKGQTLGQYVSLIKVSKSQNKFMKSSFLPKYEQNILRISALASKKWLNQKLYYTNYVK